LKRKNPLLMLFGAIVVVVVGVLFAVMSYSGVAWNKGKPLTTLDPQGPNAQNIQTLVSPVFGIAALVFVAVMGIILYICFRFRDTGDIETADVLPGQLHGKTWAEIAWTIAPALVLLIVGVLTVQSLATLNAEPLDTALNVRVEGQQWWWSFKYDLSNDGRGNGSFEDPEDIVTANELVIPVGREIALSETSNDVIHSFWIPALNGKKDAVPGLITEWKLQADHTGVYRGQCTEFCGLSHANMRMLVRAVNVDDFALWQANQLKPAIEPAEGSKEAAGKAVFTSSLCASCHLIRGVNDKQVADPATGVRAQLVAGAAPDLTHFASRGTFAGSIFNSRYPNPADNPDQPFGQTCSVRNSPGTPDLHGNKPDEASLKPCPPANQEDAFLIPFAAAPGNPNNAPDLVTLKEWLRDPPKMKPMAPLPEENPDSDGRRRGMPNLKLSEDQIDQLAAYLSSLS